MKENNVWYLSDPGISNNPESLYMAVRKKEDRLLSDEQALQLPYLPWTHPHAKEWRLRASTLSRFCKKTPFSGPMCILDLGCGNGWMAHILAKHPQTQVWAVDVNRTELEQGARIFKQPNLRFVYADYTVLKQEFTQTFDLILMAASVQYFPDLEVLVGQLCPLLKSKGQIHFMDSPFYQNAEAKKAAQTRSLRYYTNLGFPEMAAYYHHHLLSEAVSLGAKNRNQGWWIRLIQFLRMRTPFPWLVIDSLQ